MRLLSTLPLTAKRKSAAKLVSLLPKQKKPPPQAASVRAKGKSLGRPRRVFRRDEVLRLRAEDMSWRKIAEVLDVPMSTVIDSFRQSTD